ncbi:hypothetical protein MSG28_005038 [Choristoneura fumiferana]|uniref:Uncharacterized protein n=1 Tax=Choristoneura fumiferana TaxID=7141 RepID=A0ACC0JPQ4_CHOFU|nr:hypothetical protein MSG28_005038 [Choristoneura fumiferana]
MDNTLTEKLLQAIKKRPVLYLSSHPNFKNKTCTLRAWKEVRIEVNEDVEVMKNRWKNLKDTYRKCKNARLGKGNRKAKLAHWIWAEDMSFLDTGKDTPQSPNGDLTSSIATPASPIEATTSPIETPTSPIETPNSPIETPAFPIETPTFSIESPTSLSIKQEIISDNDESDNDLQSPDTENGLSEEVLKNFEDSKQLTFMYLANDVIQNSKKKGPEYGQEFGEVLEGALKHMAKTGINAKTKHSLHRILNIWQERGVYDAQKIQELKVAVDPNDAEPKKPNKRKSTDTEPKDPEKKPRTDSKREEKRERNEKREKEDKRERRRSETKVEALLELESSASSDEAVRERIASLPPEVSEVQLLSKLEDKESAVSLSAIVNSAVDLLAEYNLRLTEELEKRRKEYNVKLQKIYAVKTEVKSHIENLPDVSQLPDVTGGLAPLPSAEGDSGDVIGSNSSHVFVGYPMFFLELVIGAVTKKGVLSAWDLAPVARGVGCSMLLTSAVTALALGVVAAWWLALAVHSAHSFLPWLHCAAAAQPPCAARHRPLTNDSETPANSFFFNFVLNLKRDDLEGGMGKIVWELYAYYLVLFKDVLAFFVLICCAIGCTRLEGAGRMFREYLARSYRIRVTRDDGLSGDPGDAGFLLSSTKGQDVPDCAVIVRGFKDLLHAHRFDPGCDARSSGVRNTVGGLRSSRPWKPVLVRPDLLHSSLTVQTIMSTFSGRSIRKITWAFLIIICSLFCTIGVITLCTQNIVRSEK